MITTMINNHLSVIQEASSRGISPHKLENVIPDKRPCITLVTRAVNITADSWNKALSSTSLIHFINTTSLADEIVDNLLKPRYPLGEIEKIIKLPYIESIYKKLKKNLEKDYTSRHNLTFADWLLDVLSYISIYGFDRVGMKDLLQTVSSMSSCRETEAQYPDLCVEDRAKIIRLWSMPYLNIKNISVFKQYNIVKESLPFIDIYEEANEMLGPLVFNQIFPAFHQSLVISTNKEALLKSIRVLLNELDSNISTHYFKEIFGDNENIVLDSEIHKLSRNITEHSSKDVYSMIYGENSLAYEVLHSTKEFEPYQVNLLKRCVESGKKGFLRLILDDRARELYHDLDVNNLLFKEEFQKIVNLNTLNNKNLLTISSMKYREGNLDLLNPDIPLTFDEFCFLHGKKKINIDFYYTLAKSFNVEARLKISRELPDLSTVKDLYQTTEELFEALVALVSIKPVKQWINEEQIKLEDAKDFHYLKMLLVPHRFRKFQSSVKRGSDVDFILNEKELLSVADNLDEAKLLFVEQNEACRFVLNKIEVTPDFIQKYKGNIVNFYEKGLCNIFQKLHNSSSYDKKMLLNLNLITKAELSGKLSEIKFAEEDFELEIGLPVPSHVISEWVKNRTTSTKELNIQETFDYESTLRLGEYPVSTCLHWNSGSYSQCLLSNFDTNKKILLAKNRRGNIVARAIIRLTKGSNNFVLNKSIKEKKLRFKDVEAQPEQDTLQKVKPKEELVLFLERCYTSMNGKSALGMRKKFVKLAIEKSKALGAKLIIADGYAQEGILELQQYTKENYFIFVSYSKNGYQYLDSLSGQASESNEGKYMKAKVIFLKERNDQPQIDLTLQERRTS
ncbi:hypothetical protein [Paenibacillus terrae]|uniref:Uncharacterized protein n=1 Tax=Paenibacillus terrae TaxID=159743 RepID=A0A0D7WU04_9BACL|nr:hypothetical protein [Paenibacillus terrae]KJD42645.1 hypothetical protein QD47_27030 [Paenibacillus terrae]